MPIRIKATKEIIDGSLNPNQTIILREPFILAININNTNYIFTYNNNEKKRWGGGLYLTSRNHKIIIHNLLTTFYISIEFNSIIKNIA